MKKGDEIRVIGGMHAGKTGNIISNGAFSVEHGGDGESCWVRFPSGESDWVPDEFLEIITDHDPNADLTSPLQSQVGGDHYRKLAIQPVEFCQRNQLGYCESAVIKYVTRHREKNGVEDIDKAIHYLQLLKEIEYPETTEKP